jgi:hypothetical protein
MSENRSVIAFGYWFDQNIGSVFYTFSKSMQKGLRGRNLSRQTLFAQYALQGVEDKRLFDRRAC